MGKIPKAFKIIPNLRNWEEVLWLTDPDEWSPHAMFEVRVKVDCWILITVCVCSLMWLFALK